MFVSLNSSLISPDIMKELVHILIDDNSCEDDKIKRYRNPYVASKILSSSNALIHDALCKTGLYKLILEHIKKSKNIETVCAENISKVLSSLINYQQDEVCFIFF